jgi:hypothetical protein
VVKVKIGNDTLINAAEGNGPVNALDVALRKDLGKYQTFIGGLKLTDYRVRILNSGTEAVTRVLIESEDETGEHWTTVGVSSNIIDASYVRHGGVDRRSCGPRERCAGGAPRIHRSRLPHAGRGGTRGRSGLWRRGGEG